MSYLKGLLLTVYSEPFCKFGHDFPKQKTRVHSQVCNLKCKSQFIPGTETTGQQGVKHKITR